MFDITKARQEIEHRNRLRAEVHLPPLDVEAELTRMELAAEETEFELFFLTHRESVMKEVLGHWVPSGSSSWVVANNMIRKHLKASFKFQIA
jgi:hypothetical protein